MIYKFSIYAKKECALSSHVTPPHYQVQSRMGNPVSSGMVPDVGDKGIKCMKKGVRWTLNQVNHVSH